MNRHASRAKAAAQITIDRQVGRVAYLAKLEPIEGEPAPFTYQRIIDAARELKRKGKITEPHARAVVEHFKMKLAGFALDSAKEQRP